MRYCFSLFLCLFILSCNAKKGEVEKQIKEIPMEFELHRFDKDFALATPDELPTLKSKYPDFFPIEVEDEIWVAKMNDEDQIILGKEILKVFPEDKPLVDELKALFQHIKYYFPKFEPPVVYTATSDWDYQTKVILVDNVLIIALDNYLGSENEIYEGIERYFVKEMKPSQIAPEVANAYGERLVAQKRKATFLDLIVYHGKLLYLKDLWLPKTSDAVKIGYTDEEYKWAEDNEADMWRYFIENELLYSTDPKLPARFVNPAPFSKFYLEIDNESPGRLGQYLGWQIVKAYMKNNEVDVQQLMHVDAEEIFIKSKYKPRK